MQANNRLLRYRGLPGLLFFFRWRSDDYTLPDGVKFTRRSFTTAFVLGHYDDFVIFLKKFMLGTSFCLTRRGDLLNSSYIRTNCTEVIG